MTTSLTACATGTFNCAAECSGLALQMTRSFAVVDARLGSVERTLDAFGSELRSLSASVTQLVTALNAAHPTAAASHPRLPRRQVASQGVTAVSDRRDRTPMSRSLACAFQAAVTHASPGVRRRRLGRDQTPKSRRDLPVIPGAPGGWAASAVGLRMARTRESRL